MTASHLDSSLVGAEIGGSYRVVSRIGCGGMGVVYEAYETAVDRPVVLKLLHPDLAEDPNVTRCFRQEAKAASRLSHPNSVSIYGFGESRHGLYIAMELVPGPTLESLLEREMALPAKRACQIIRMVASAVGQAHELGIIHRDLKPANVIVSSYEGKDWPKVLDFGLARVRTDEDACPRRRTERPVGTRAYMAPEQSQGRPVTAAADVYSLGVMLYEMLSGRLPRLPAKDLTGMLVNQTDDLPDLSTLADVDPELEAIVHRALEKEPCARYQNASELAAHLEHYERTSLNRTGRRMPAEPPFGLKLTAAMFALLFFVLGLLGAVLVRDATRPAPDAPLPSVASSPEDRWG